MQVDLLVAADAVEYVPAGHAVQAADPETLAYVPAGQGIEALAPAFE
jgi:hypothetical protein